MTRRSALITGSWGGSDRAHILMAISQSRAPAIRKRVTRWIRVKLFMMEVYCFLKIKLFRETSSIRQEIPPGDTALTLEVGPRAQ